jgi:hypothetical protein
MGRPLGGLVDRVKRHPAWSAAGAAGVSAVASAVVSGAQSYTMRGLRALFTTWHSFPAAGWLVVGLLSVLGMVCLWDRWRASRALPDEALGVRWRIAWAGRKVKSLEPLCPNPNCGRDLVIRQAGGQYGEDAEFACDGPACGFRIRYEDPKATVLADARRELEARAGGGPPPPEKPRQIRVYLLGL